MDLYSVDTLYEVPSYSIIEEYSPFALASIEVNTQPGSDRLLYSVLRRSSGIY